MKTSDAIAFFGSRYRIAIILGVRPPSVHKLQLERASRGELVADPALKIKPPRRPRKRTPAPLEPALVTSGEGDA